MGGDGLVEAVSDIVGILLGRHARIVLEAAALHFSAVADGGALRPVKAGGHLELVSPLVVDAEDDGAEIADPGLVAGGVAGHIERRARTVGMDHQSRELVRHVAAPAGRGYGSPAP